MSKNYADLTLQSIILYQILIYITGGLLVELAQALIYVTPFHI